MNLARRQRLMTDGLALGVLGGLGAVWYVGLVRPLTLREQDSLATRVRHAEAERELTESQKRIESLRAHERLLVEERERAPQLVNGQRLNERLGEFPAVAEARGLVIDEITTGAPSGDARLSRTPIRISGRASYEACALFLGDIHERFPDTEVSSLEIAGESEGADVRAMFSAELIWWTVPGAPPVPTAPGTTTAEVRTDR